MKVVTLNTMLVCVGPFGVLESAPDLVTRSLGIGRWLRAEDPDFACLQEVFRREHLDLITSQWRVPFVSFGPSGTGLAILSKWPLSPAQFAPFRWQASFLRECQRVVLRMMKGVLSVFATTPEGPLLVATTHSLPRYAGIAGFANEADAITPERNANSLELLAVLASLHRPACPIVLGGDMNMNQRSLDYAFFARVSGMVDALRTKVGTDEWRELCTYCDENIHVRAQGNEGEGVLDHVMLSPDDFDIVEARIASDVGQFSDHCAVVATMHQRARAAGDRRWRPTTPSRMPTAPELHDLVRYFAGVRPHPLVYLGPLTGWRQRARIVDFLQQFSADHRSVDLVVEAGREHPRDAPRRPDAL